MNTPPRPLAVVSGASTAIGLELARVCARKKFDLIIAADEILIENAADELTDTDVGCHAVRCDAAKACHLS